MRLRPAPTDARSIWAPAVIREAPTNETCLLARRDGTLELYAITKPASDSVSVTRSHNGGLAWTEPQVAFPLPGKAYYALQVLESREGTLHAVTHLQGEGAGGYRGRLYEVYHATKAAGAAAWTAPRRIVPGYVGSIRGFTELKRGRLVLTVARAIPEREKAPTAGPDFGWNDTFVYFSDDAGATWRQSPDTLSLELKSANATRYGAIEPVPLELLDGRVWLLVRDRGGRLWQSFSPDGERWPALERSPFISSDSPAALLRLRDGKIILFANACQNWTDPRSYAMGGREVLHAAISGDDGQTWRGFREVLHEKTVVNRGDRGTAYASAVENSAGKVVVVSGQGEGNRAVFAFDPRWLEEREVRDDLTAGPTAWTQYGDEGLHVEATEGGVPAISLPLTSSRLGGALWNFPLTDAGELKFRIQIPPQARAVRLGLTDHFNRIDDQNAVTHAVFAIDWVQYAKGADARWHDVTLKWGGVRQKGELQLEVDGAPAGRISAQRPAQLGLNYLRVEFRGSAAQGALRLAGASMRITP